MSVTDAPAQIMAEVEASKRRARSGRGGGINIIVMNAVLEACVSCGDVDLAVQLFEEMRGPMGCGVDSVSYGVLLKVCPPSPHVACTIAA